MTDDPYARPGMSDADDRPPAFDTVSFGPGSPAPDPGRTAPAPDGRAGGGRAGRRTLLGAVAAVAVGGVAVAGYSFASRLLGGGSQPEDVLPANTVAFAKIDLNPAADQKVNAFRLLKKFPAVKVEDGDLKSTLLADLFDDNPYGLTYAKDVAPWIGDRVAIAAVPATAAKHDAVSTLLVVEFTDEDTMRAALDRADEAMRKERRRWVDADSAGADPSPVPGTAPDATPGTLPDPGTDEHPDGAEDDRFGYAVRDGYVLIGDNQAEVDKAAAAEQVLADDPGFTADEDAVDGDGKVGLAWADLGAVYDAVPAADRQDFTEMFGDSAPSGRVAAALAVEPDAVQVTGQTHDLQAAGFNTAFASEPGTTLLRGLPGDSDLAFSATGLGDALVNVWNEIGTEPLFGTLDDQADNLGLHLPDDLGAVFGTEFAAGTTIVGDEYNAVIRADTPDPDRAVAALVPLFDLSGEPDVTVEKAGGGYQATTDKAWAAAGDGTLGANPVFTDAVADPEHANAVLFVNLDSLIKAFGDFLDDEDKNLAPLQAFGLSAAGDGSNGRFTVRVTTKK